MTKNTPDQTERKRIQAENPDGTETFETSNGEIYVIHPFDGKMGRKIILRLIDLIKPSPDQMKSPLAMGNALMGGSSSSFVEKADSLIEDMMFQVFHKPKNAMGTAESPALIRLDDGYCGIHFKKNYMTMVELILEVINFNDFFDLTGLLPVNMIKVLMEILGTTSIKPAKK